MSARLSSNDWDTASAAYAARAEYVTSPCAEELLSWVHEESPFSAPGATAIDNGAGSGVVTVALRTRFPTIPILAADLSPVMLETIEKKRLPQVRCQVLDAIDLSPIVDGTFTHALSNFMIQFTPDPLRALQEMCRVCKAGATIGLCMWGELCFDAPWEETVRHFEPDYTYPHTWTPDWSDEERIQAYIREAGFKDVRSKIMRPKWDFESPEEYFEFFLESKNPEFIRAYQPWWDKDMKSTMRPMLENIVRERYGGAKDFDMKALLFVARK